MRPFTCENVEPDGIGFITSPRICTVPCELESSGENVDADCDLDYIPNAGRAASPAAALCNCLGFGSKNSAIILGAV